ncbi:hypothetical protein GF402_05050 [Candidatus Fermentibacteria bacterium]|nr:hypothetical protein [Candidatus Fermentibacteria bacterium]
MLSLYVLLALCCNGRPVITEVMANPEVETAAEYVELYNPGDSAITVAGFHVCDGDALDPVLAWEESAHGAFPDPDGVTGTDTIPSGGFAVLFELDYPAHPSYDLPAGTVVLTTADHAICNGLSALSDPLTLFCAEGTADSNAVSTYGTPHPSDVWEDRDDDGLDGIPYDPGDGLSVERLSPHLSDAEESWGTSAPGGSPGAFSHLVDSTDAAVVSVVVIPDPPDPGLSFSLRAVFLNCGLTLMQGIDATLFLDGNADSSASPAEVLLSSSIDLAPGESDTLSADTVLALGCYLAAASCGHPSDRDTTNDHAAKSFRTGNGVRPIITEVLCNPSDEDRDEMIEIHYPGPGILDVTGYRFTDGDALDSIIRWNPSSGEITDPNALARPYVPAGHYALILDSEYASGMQPYDLPESTVVLTTSNTTLGDGLAGNDPITLYRPGGTTSEHVVSTYGTPLDSDDPLLRDDDGLDGIPYDPGQNNSVHRLRLDGPDRQSNWGSASSGPTPGAPPPEIHSGPDASLEWFEVDPPMSPTAEPVSLSVRVANRGNAEISSPDLRICFFQDLDGDSLPGQNELLGKVSPPGMEPSDTSTVTLEWLSTPGCTGLISLAECDIDSFPGNDTLRTCFNPASRVIINELMYHPLPGDPEWIELYNPSAGPVELTGWMVADALSGHSMAESCYVIRPHSFAVLAPDREAFRAAWPDAACEILVPDGWPVLNNSPSQGAEWADNVRLYTSTGRTEDWVPYSDSWGGAEGVSLERVDPMDRGYLPSNWAGCRDTGTPGIPNSTGGQTADGELLVLSPNPFSPDGDGRDDRLTVTVSPRGPSRLTLEVYNVQGRLVRRLSDGESVSGTIIYEWDGRSDRGSGQSVGRYVVYVLSERDDGEVREAVEVVVLARRL